MTMTVAQLKARLDDFGDHLRVLVVTDEHSDLRKEIDSADTEDDDGELVLVLYPE